MPDNVEHLETWIKDIGVVRYFDLTEEQIKEDTETVKGTFYSLPKTTLLWIQLYTDTINGAVEWGTLRRYTPEKWQYYKEIVGKQVRIEILSGGD